MISQADIVLYIIDSLSQESSARHDFFKKLKPGSKTYYVYNKIDLVSDYEKSRIKAQNPDALLISAETKEGLDSLESSLVEYVENKLPVHETEILTKTRHYNAILKSYEFITHARESIEQGYSSEFIALDLRSALDSMGQLTGYVTSDDILNNIFSNFCVGK
ncbi:MAG: hypothetical protein U5R06_22460 [candidate division KSB1 bacterium]|nr:hypothetical protein [candidate division KSB1 bacterium]